jgi:uncharacterized protein (TIGR03437 family)
LWYSSSLFVGGKSLRTPKALLVLPFCGALAAQAISYSYDAAGRLNAVTYPDGKSMTYAYDAAGNLLRRLVAKPVTGPAPVTSTPGVLNAASEIGGAVAPGEIAVIYGTGIGPSTLTGYQISPANFFETFTADTSVTFDGIPAPLIYSSSLQTAAIVPYSVAGQSSTQMVVTFQGRASAPIGLAVAKSAPGLFSADESGAGNGAIINQDGTANSPSNPAPRGSVIALYGTGEGQTSPVGIDGRIALSVYPKPVLPVKVTLGGVDISANIAYMGSAPTLVAGIFQLNVAIPGDAQTGAVPIVVTVGSASSQPGLTVSIQ